MKAIVQVGYGRSDVLKLMEVDPPAAKDDEVLVKVHASAIHAGDYYSMIGAPFSVRLAVGFPKPKGYIPGYDVAGTVEAIGPLVKRFRVGEQVFGGCNACCAQYVSTPEKNLVHAPQNLRLEELAAVTTSAVAAVQGLRDVGKVQAGQSVLINGASGGVGTFAVQIAKAIGAEVTGVCSTRNVELVRSLGADHVIDYTQEDFTQGAEKYDVLLDNVASRSLAECRRVLKPHGIHVPNSGNAGIGFIANAFLSSFFIKKQGRPYLATPRNEDLEYLKGLIEMGQLKPVIDRRYRMDAMTEAMDYIGTGHARGKVVIIIDDDGIRDAQSL